MSCAGVVRSSASRFSIARPDVTTKLYSPREARLSGAVSNSNSHGYLDVTNTANTTLVAAVPAAAWRVSLSAPSSTFMIDARL